MSSMDRNFQDNLPASTEVRTDIDTALGKLELAIIFIQNALNESQPHEKQDFINEAASALHEARKAIERSENAQGYTASARSNAEVARHHAEDAMNTARHARTLAGNLQGADTALRIAEEAVQKATTAEKDAATAREKAELAEKRFEIVLEGSNEGLWDCDLKSQQVYWRGRFFSQLGAPEIATVPIEQALFHQVHPEDQSQLRETVLLALENGESFESGFRIRDKEG